MLMKFKLLFLFMTLIIACQDHDTTGKIVIEYDNNWSSVITRK